MHGLLRICVRGDTEHDDDAGWGAAEHDGGETEAKKTMCLCGDVAYDILTWILSDTGDAEGKQ